uniref:Uncharacterized protein n=1 Tax=Xenopus tropicalis TaxID=8364 RepID=A0A6I8RNK5_XENTR
MVCSVCTGAMRIETFDWKIPFDHKRQPSLSNVYYLVGSLVWDYAITVTTLHVCICCIVTTEFPLIWQWWVEIGCGMLLMLGCGQTLAHLTVTGTPNKHSEF